MEEPDRSGARLDSWKAIAAYLGREVRTAQRWERSEGLPVHRLGHQKRGSVYAFAGELDAWRQQRAPQIQEVAVPAALASAPGLRRGRVWRALGLTAAMLGMGVLVLYWRHAGAPAEPRRDGTVNGNWQRLFAASTAEGGRYRLLAAGPSPGALALAEGGRELYVAHFEARTLSVLDTRAQRVARHVLPWSLPLVAWSAGFDSRQGPPASAQGSSKLPPPAATITLRGRPLLLAVSGGLVLAGGPDGLEAVDSRTQRVTRVPLAGGVYDIAATPDGRFAYLAERFDGLGRLDLARLEVEHLATTSCPSALALSPDGRTLYVGYQCGGPAGTRGHDSIGVWDTARGQFTASLAGDMPLVATALAVSPDGNELWVSGGDVCTAAYDHRGCPAGATGLVYVYSTATRKRLHTLALRTGPVNHMQFIAGGRLALLDAAVFDTTRHEVLETIPDLAGAIVTAPERARAFVSLPERGAVAVFDAPRRLCRPPAADLVGWWPGDGSGADAWGNLEAQTPAGQGYVPGLTGQAFGFAGGVGVNLGHDLSLQSAGFTVGAWVKAAGSGAVFSRGAPGTGWSLGFNAAHQIALCVGAQRPCRTLPGWPLGRWHHLALASDERVARPPLAGAALPVVGLWPSVAPRQRTPAGAQGVSKLPRGEVTIYGDGRALARLAVQLSAMAPGSDLELGRGWRGKAGEVVFYARPLRAGELAPLLAQPACFAAAGRRSPAH